MTDIQVQVPEAFIPPLAALGSLDENHFARFANLLNGEPPLVVRSDILSAAKTEVPEISGIAEIFDALVALENLRFANDWSVEDIAAAIVSTDQSIAGAGDELQKLGERIAAALSTASLPLAAKALDILFSNERLVERARIITDIRPVFRDRPDEAPEAALRGLCGLLADRTWINHYSVAAMADSKVVQLQSATAHGITIPDSIITDNHNRVRDFFEAHCALGVVYKALALPVVYSTDEERGFLYTTRLSRRHIDTLAEMHKVPMLLQALVPRAVEYRVTVIDSAVFTATIRVPTDAPPDWRRGSGDYTHFSRGSLPDHLESSLLAMLSDLGLRYAAVDLIERPDGEIVFLEANPAGAWLWLEDELELPITAAIAEALARP